MEKRRRSPNYRSFLAAHPHLKNGGGTTIEAYAPIYRLGELMRHRLPGIIKKYAGEKSLQLEDYIPSLNNPSASVTSRVNDNLRSLIGTKVTHIPWPSNSTDKNKTLQIFWYCYGRALRQDANKMENWPSIKLLDLMCVFLDYRNFYQFIEREYPLPGKSVNVVLLPFLTDSESWFVEDTVRQVISEMAAAIGEEIQVVNCENPGNKDIKDLAKEYLNSLGLSPDESLVLNGKLFSPGTFTLECEALNNVWAKHNGKFSETYNLHDLRDSMAIGYKKIQLSIYWCLFNRNFYHNDLELSYHYLNLAFKLKLDYYEVPFRVGVLHDLMENSRRAKMQYLDLLRFLGVEDAKEQLRHMLTFPVQSTSPNTDSGLHILDDYIDLDDITINCPNFYTEKKTMYFEIVRMQLFSHLKDKLNPDTFKRVLKKIVDNTRGEWLSDKFVGLFGEANFEMGKLLMNNLDVEDLLNFDDAIGYFEKAITYSSDESIHSYCIPILSDPDRLAEVTALVERVHKNNPTILALYGLLPPPESASTNQS